MFSAKLLTADSDTPAIAASPDIGMRDRMVWLVELVAVVRAVGLEPTQALRPNGFSYRFGFRRRPAWAFVVWTIPSP